MCAKHFTLNKLVHSMATINCVWESLFLTHKHTLSLSLSHTHPRSISLYVRFALFEWRLNATAPENNCSTMWFNNVYAHEELTQLRCIPRWRPLRQDHGICKSSWNAYHGQFARYQRIAQPQYSSSCHRTKIANINEMRMRIEINSSRQQHQCTLNRAEPNTAQQKRNAS